MFSDPGQPRPSVQVNVPVETADSRMNRISGRILVNAPAAVRPASA